MTSRSADRPASSDLHLVECGQRLDTQVGAHVKMMLERLRAQLLVEEDALTSEPVPEGCVAGTVLIQEGAEA